MVCWLKDGDCSTKFFHMKSFNCRSKNEIFNLLDSNGCWQDDAKIVESLLAAISLIFSLRLILC